MRFALVLLIVVMVGLVVPAESWLFGRRFRARARELWIKHRPQLIQAGINALANRLIGRSVEEVDLDAMARSLDMDRRSEEFREFSRAIDLNGDDTITPEEVDFAFR